LASSTNAEVELKKHAEIKKNWRANE